MIKPKDKKTLTIMGVCVSAIFLFWALIYFPAGKRLKSLSSELAAIKNEISEIESAAGDKRDVTKMVELLKKDLESAKQKLPADDDAIYKFISGEASKLGAEIISMQPKSRAPLLGSNGAPVFIGGKQCFEAPVTIEMRGLYRSVGEYLRALRESSPSLITVEYARIQKDESISPRLRVTLTLKIYLLV